MALGLVAKRRGYGHPDPARRDTLSRRRRNLATAERDATSTAPFPAVQPLDEHNQRLLENAHPPAWRNPEPKDHYHLVVIGAGTGGLVTAAIGAALGARVALVERELMGGDCLNVGCVPSKGIIRAARAWKASSEGPDRFGAPRASGEGDFSLAMERMRRIRADISPVDSASRYRDMGVDVFLGDGRFVSEDTVEVGGKRLRFGRAVIATGARGATPSIEGLQEAGYLTNETVFSLTERPKHLVVIGGGPIGCEMAQAFRRLGNLVTLIESGDRILPYDDAEAAAIVAESMRRDGVEIVFAAKVERVVGAGETSVVHYKRHDEAGEATGTHVLVAIGRAPNVEDLGLEAAGVGYGKKGVDVDDRLRTSNSRIYAVGDVASKYQFTHAASAHAQMVVRNALFFGRGKASDLVMPWCTYTSPELAHVGMTAEEAREQDAKVDTITVPLREVDRARLDGEDEGFLRVYLEKGTDKILGATLVAEHAGDIITHVTHAMTTGTGLGKFQETIFPYPTQAEVLPVAATEWSKKRLTPLAKSVFTTYFRAFR
jgi:pyruvate/2-oxoglutarate dehydrogenase complex dihydrolipoamide dehydrogenase (E3) component